MTRTGGAHSIVGAFLDGEAVCEGYSRALQLFIESSRGFPVWW